MTIKGPDPVDSPDALYALGETLAAVLRRLGRPDLPGRASRPDGAHAAAVADARLDALSHDERVALSVRVAHSYLAQLDKQLAAGRLIGIDAPE